MVHPTETIEVQNVVGATSFGIELDLDQLSDDLPGAEYDRDNFPGLIHRTDDPKATTLLFRSGKTVTTGATAKAEIQTAVKDLASKLQALGLDVPEEPDISVENIVSSAELPERLNLSALAIGLGLEVVEYEPEQFPGLVYRIDQPDVVVLLFASGNVVITGATNETQIPDAIKSVRSEIQSLGMEA